MDNYIASLVYTRNGPLNICGGVAYQNDMSNSVKYEDEYFDKYVRYENNDISEKITRGRLDVIQKYCPGENIIDVGIGSGQIIKTCYQEKRNFRIYGYDINPRAIAWLKEKDLYRDIEDLAPFSGVCFFDSFEHIKDPGAVLDKIKTWSYVFMSIPIVNDMDTIFSWKHYRPDEHYYYFTEQGLYDYMYAKNLHFIEKQNFEIKAGREDIYTYVWRKV